jgi:hypothetical protein
MPDLPFANELFIFGLAALRVGAIALGIILAMIKGRNERRRLEYWKNIEEQRRSQYEDDQNA